MNRSAVLLGLALACGSIGSALAHHSFAMFDREKMLTITGTVKAWEFTAPHSWLHILTKDAAGREVEWSFEGRGPSGSSMRHDSFHPGDIVTIQTHPVKDGRPAGELTRATLANGQVLSDGPPPPPPKSPAPMP